MAMWGILPRNLCSGELGDPRWRVGDYPSERDILGTAKITIVTSRRRCPGGIVTGDLHDM